MTYTQNFRHLCRTLTVWSPSREATDHGTLADPTYTQGPAILARVKERSAMEVPGLPMDYTGTAAEVTVDVADGANVQENDLLRDAAHPLGLRVWRVAGVELRGGPVPRVLLKCTQEQMPPTEVR